MDRDGLFWGENTFRAVDLKVTLLRWYCGYPLVNRPWSLHYLVKWCKAFAISFEMVGVVHLNPFPWVLLRLSNGCLSPTGMLVGKEVIISPRRALYAFWINRYWIGERSCLYQNIPAFWLLSPVSTCNDCTTTVITDLCYNNKYYYHERGHYEYQLRQLYQHPKSLLLCLADNFASITCWQGQTLKHLLTWNLEKGCSFF